MYCDLLGKVRLFVRKQACPEFARFTFDQFLNVRTAVGSRNFGIVVNGDKRTATPPAHK